MTPREAVHAFYDRIWNRRDKAAIAELLQPDFTFRGSLGPTMTGHAPFAAYVAMVTGRWGRLPLHHSRPCVRG
jgi:SnoaL-like protein